MDIFNKCYNYSLANELRAKGIYPYFHALETRQDTEVIMEGKRRIMLGSNNYLGLTTCPEVQEAGLKALEQYGTGCSGSRFLNGTLKLHLELEAELADFLHKEACCTFSTGFQSNLGIISAIVGHGDYVICDKENHASIYDGCKLSYGRMLTYGHSNMEELEIQLKKVPENAGCLIVTDGVFSMGGDIAKLPEIVKLARQYGARVMVDDAHGLGVIGEGGRGTASYFGPSPWPAWAATWWPTPPWWTSCATTPARSSSPPPSLPPARPSPWRPCGTSRPTRSWCSAWPICPPTCARA